MNCVARKGGLLLQQLRKYSAQAALTTAEESPFLRFGSPFAPQLNMNQIVAQLPDTKVSQSSLVHHSSDHVDSLYPHTDSHRHFSHHLLLLHTNTNRSHAFQVALE